MSKPIAAQKAIAVRALLAKGLSPTEAQRRVEAVFAPLERRQSSAVRPGPPELAIEKRNTTQAAEGDDSGSDANDEGGGEEDDGGEEAEDRGEGEGSDVEEDSDGEGGSDAGSGDSWSNDDQNSDDDDSAN